MRNGLKNASGTALMSSGSAFGNGCYLSPASSVSASYANMYSYLSSSASESVEMKRHFESDYLEPGEDVENTPVRAILICEVANKDLRINDDIWVQPHENCVVTRFLFVYTHGHEAPTDIDLKLEINQEILNRVLDSS